MNNKKTSKFAIRRAKETKLGRILCRLAGEENGAVMMEYVIVAVVIAAACALIMAIWGKAIFGQATGAIKATEGNPHAAEKVVENSRTQNALGITEAKGNQEKFHGDITTTTVDNPTEDKK